MTSRFLDAIANRREIPVAVWITLPSASIVEMLGNHGVDAAIIDLEHTPFSLETVQELVIAAELAGVTPLVRVPMGDVHAVNRVLDSGAQGVLFPCVSTGDEAERMAQSLWFAPRGTRGWGGRHIRAVRWNTTSPDLSSSAYVDAVNAGIANVIMIETPEGVENVEEIVTRGTPDAVIFGLADYSVAVGFDDERTEAAARRVYAVCRAHGIGLGLLPGSLGAPAFAPGDFCVAGVDSLLVDDAIGRRIASVRDTLASEQGVK